MDQAVRARHAAADLEQTVSELAAVFGNRLVTSRAVREQHANTVTWAAAEPPDAVFACSMLRCG